MLPYQNILLTVFPSPCYSYSPPFSRVSIGLQAACIGECMEIQHWNPALWLLSHNEALYNHLTVCLDSKYPNKQHKHTKVQWSGNAFIKAHFLEFREDLFMYKTDYS